MTSHMHKYLMYISFVRPYGASILLFRNTSQVFIFTASEKLSYIDLLSKKSTYKLERIGGNGYKIYTTQQANHAVSRYDTQ